MATERNRAAEVIEVLGHEAIRAETHGSTGSPALNICLDMAKTCDLYVGIFGARYGSVPPGLSVSVTELEFDMARGSDPTKILVYRQEGVTEARQLEFLERVEHFTEGYFRRPRFRVADELAEFLRTDIPDWISDRIRRNTVSVVAKKSVTPTPRRRPPTEEEVQTSLEGIDSGLPKLRIEVLKDIEMLSYQVEIEKSPEVLGRLRGLLRGSAEVRIQTFRTLRVFLSVSDPAYRRNLGEQLHDQILEQFSVAKDLPVKQEAMNLFAEVVQIDDLEHILHHVVAADDSVYPVTRPFYLLELLKNQGHGNKVRSALYDLKQGALPPKVEARLDELLAYLRVRH